MKYLFLLIFIPLLLTGCATKSGHFADGPEYKEYDVLFDRDVGEFYVPLEWTEEQKVSNHSQEK